MNKYDLETATIKAIAHPSRLAIIDMLRSGDLPISEIVTHIIELTGCDRPYVSQHLTALRRHYLIETSNNICSVPDKQVFKLVDLVELVTRNALKRMKNSIDPSNEE